MKIPRLAGFLFSVILAVVILIPPYVTDVAPADAAIMAWSIVYTPGSYGVTPLYGGRFDILSPGDIIDYAVGKNGVVVAIVRSSEATGVPRNVLYYSKDNGISWSQAVYNILTLPGSQEIFNVAIAPDNPAIWAITISDSNITGPTHVHYTDEYGTTWLDTSLTLTDPAETIRSIDISPDDGTGAHIIGITTVTGNGGGSFYTTSSKNFGSWVNQGTTAGGLPTASADYFSIKFSPSYASDFSVALVYATATATYYNIGFRDTNQNATLNYAYSDPGVEVKDTASTIDASPGFSELIITGLQLPQDFQGQSASLRRAYISLDADKSKATGTCQDGVFRIDDNHVYVLMDTTQTPDKSIYSIAYNGTYAQGKLLVGEHYGVPCTATVATWFTDSPTSCPIPCWYPALKPTTGAADQGGCSTAKVGIGAAKVAWDSDGILAYAGTGSLDDLTGATWYDNLEIPNLLVDDESAFAISRNNGETWNQIGLIDTTIDWFNDVAPSVDCSTIYLTSVNSNASCGGFDSVWRSTTNNQVTKPLPAGQTLGSYWERVLTHTTSNTCNDVQTDKPLLRLPLGCDDKPDGEVVAWAAQLTNVQLWSGDYGDFWSSVTTPDLIQDFAFETSTILYNLSPNGYVEKLTFSGTAWNSKNKGYDSRVMNAHTIAAIPTGKILVGSAGQGVDAASFSPSGGEQWIEIPSNGVSLGNVHVAFDSNFADNKFVYLADDKMDLQGLKNNSLAGSIFREQVPAYIKLTDADMMSAANGAHAEINWPPTATSVNHGTLTLTDPPHPVGQFGVIVAKTGDPQPAVYSAHDKINTTLGQINSAVCRTLKPWQAMPKLGVPWDCLDIFTPARTDNISFTLEPSSLKACGCCTLDTNTTLYAIDDKSGGKFEVNGYNPTTNEGMLWAYTDCLAKKGPVLLTPSDGGFVGADPVTGRNQQIDMSWEQLCLAIQYDLEIYKDQQLTMKVNPAITGAGASGANITSVVGSISIVLDSVNVTAPGVWIPAGALPEAGASYYWRIRVTHSATGQIAVSPWSAVWSFSIKPGFVTQTPVLGLQLLSPKDNGTGWPIQPTSLSWTPYKEATKYEVWLAKDSDFTQMIKKAFTTSTAYLYTDALDYSKIYYWKVRSTEINGQPNTSDWSGTFTFRTVDSPPPPPTKAEIEKKQQQEENPGYVWVVIGIIVLVPALMLLLIMMSRKSDE
ncbi:MAG: hypothetical protein ACYDHZ_03745 [Dehalococcoidia bacterium]